MKSKKSLARIFFSNAIGSIIIFILAIIVFALAMIFQAYTNDPNHDKKVVENSSIFKSNYKDLNKDDVLKNDGWIEEIENNKVHKIIGKKKDSIYEYNIENLINNEDINIKYDEKVYKDDKENIFIVKIPKDDYRVQNDVVGKNLVNLALKSLLATVLFVIVAMFLMCFISIKRLSKPLKKVHKGISEMTNGNYAVRLNFNTYKEIDEIKSAFNFMVEELQKSEKEKQISEESKKRMIMDISHDIKTPITSMMGYSKALTDNKAQNEEEKNIYLGYIYNKTLRLNYLVDELFSFAKLDCLNYKLNKNVEDFGEFLRELVSFYYGELEENNFNLVMDMPEKCVYVKFDSKEMERAIGNLIVNAIKYNPPETQLKVSLQEVQEKIIVTIEDNGVGMKADAVNSMFDEFVRGDKARNSKGGSGLGLSITKKIVELHGGEITLESEEGKGTKFLIILPNE